MWLLIAFIVVPLIEIALFIQVGGAIGLWPTLGVVLATAVIGSWLVRTQGMLALGELQGSFQRLSDPTEPLAHGAMILFAGALLLTPGFFTDAIGFLLLFPPTRKLILQELRKRIKVQSFSMGSGSHGFTRTRPDPGGEVIDGEFTEAPETPSKSQKPSGWTQH
ncbi:MAG: FxsA family protein [Pseudomonadota bacterium]